VIYWWLAEEGCRKVGLLKFGSQFGWLHGGSSKEEESPDFRGQGHCYKNFKLYFVRTLYRWNEVLDHHTKLTFLDFSYNIILESG